MDESIRDARGDKSTMRPFVKILWQIATRLVVEKKKEEEERKKKEETTAVKYKPFSIAMPCGLTVI